MSKKKNKRCNFENIQNPNPENELPDLDYGGCKYLGYAGVREAKRAPEYFFRCYCGSTFKTEATNVIKRVKPSCGCSLEKVVWKESSSLFELHMESWDPTTHRESVKKLPIFKGIVGREKIIGFTYVDSEVYNVWSSIIWHKNKAGYVISNFSKDNCRRLGINYTGCRKSPTIHLHRCVIGISNEVKYVSDHINSKITDNRKINLRLATIKDNSRNKNKGPASKEGLRGIKFLNHRPEKSKTGKVNRRWVAQIQCDGKNKSKNFYNKEDAVHYRDLMCLDIHGDFAVLNYPEKINQYKEELNKLPYK